MDINLFTEKFHKMELENKLFSLKDNADFEYWDQIRHDVFYLTFTKLADNDCYLAAKTNRSSIFAYDILRNLLKHIISYIALIYAVISVKKILFVKTSRYKGAESSNLIDPIIGQFENLTPSNSLSFESHVGKKSLFHFRYLFPYSNLSLSDLSVKNSTHMLEELIFAYFNVEIDLTSVTETGLNKYRTEYRFYNRLFRYSTIKKVLIVQNGIQKGLFKAASENNVQVMEMQHGYVGFGHPAYSYPKELSDMAGIYLPHKFLSYSDFWVKNSTYPVSENYIIGSSNHPKISTKNSSHYCFLIISGDIYHHDLSKLTIKLAKEYKEIKLIYKLHPNQFKDFGEIQKKFVGYSNIELISNQLSLTECISKVYSIICIQSTCVYEAIASNRSVYCYKKLDYKVHNDLFDNASFHLFSDFNELSTLLFQKKLNISKSNEIFFKEFDSELANNLLQIKC